jgi:hypothetical protein
MGQGAGGAAGRLLVVRCDSRLESTVGTPNASCGRATGSSDLAVLLCSQRNERQAGAELSMTSSTVSGRSMGTAGPGRSTAALEQPANRQSSKLLAEPVGRSHDHGAELAERFAADIDSAATSRRAIGARPRAARPRVAAQASRWRAQPARFWQRRGRRLCHATAAPFAARGRSRARLAAAGQQAGKAGAVAAAALDRPGAPARRVPVSDAKQLAIAARGRVRCRPGDQGTGGRSHNCQRVFVTVRIDAEHVVQLVCKHQTRSSDQARRVRWCRSDPGKPRRQDCDESRR